MSKKLRDSKKDEPSSTIKSMDNYLETARAKSKEDLISASEKVSKKRSRFLSDLQEQSKSVGKELVSRISRDLNEKIEEKKTDQKTFLTRIDKISNDLTSCSKLLTKLEGNTDKSSICAKFGRELISDVSFIYLNFKLKLIPFLSKLQKFDRDFDSTLYKKR